MKDTFAFLSTIFLVYLYFIIVGILFVFYILGCIIKNVFVWIWKKVKSIFTYKINL